MQNNGNERYQARYGRVVVPAEHYGVWSSARSVQSHNGVQTAQPVSATSKFTAKPAKSTPATLPKVQPRSRTVAQSTPYRRQTRQSGVTLDHMQPLSVKAPSPQVTKMQSVAPITLATPSFSHGVKHTATTKSTASKVVSPTQKRPAGPVTYQPTMQARRDREHIMQQAAIVREEAKRRAEAAANAEIERQLAVARQSQQQEQTQTRTATQPVMMAQFEPVPAGAMAGGGSAPLPTTTTSPLANLMSSHVTINFKFNKEKILQALRYIAVAVIILVSGYLAYDTYMTNKAVRATVSNSSSAASISGTNPATADQTAVSQEDKAAYVVPDDQPRYLYIPAIGLNQARVMSVGVNSKGNIDTPSNLNDTAWYDGSAKPGQDGEVFIDGHTSFNRSIAAAFNDLPKLKSGDQITIEKGNGDRINYTVHSTETVAADKVDMGKALNPVKGAKKGLTLMTCAGKFNYRTQTADKRFIVYAVQS